MGKADAAVLAALQDELLTPAFVEMVVSKVLTRAVPTGAELDEARARILPQLTDVSRELEHLVEGIARTGVSAALSSAIRKREAQKAQLETELAMLERREQVSHVELKRLQDLARGKATEWASTMRRHTPQARQILAKMLRDKLSFRPERRDKQDGYRFTGEGTITALLTGLVPGLSQAVASPKGAATHSVNGSVLLLAA